YVKPKVVIYSTGEELEEPGVPLKPGKIYDVNRFSLSAAVEEAGCQPSPRSILPDDYGKLKEAILEGVKEADVVLVSGGTSAGAGDLLYRVLEELSGGLLFHGVAVKPGKPTAAALIEGKPVFALPGYPSSALMVFLRLVKPVLRFLAGLPPFEEEELVEARVGEKIFSVQGRLEFLPVHLVSGREGLTVFPAKLAPGAVSALASADGFIEIGEEKAFLEEGEKVKVRLFSRRLMLPDLTIIGSHCLGLELLLKLLREKHPEFTVKTVWVGSSAGLSALRRGEADLAGIHLLDEKTGQYNLPFIEEFGLKGRVALFSGYLRRQGFMVASGNPKGFKGLEDLLRPDIKMINRNPGSGTRILLDFHLKRLAESQGLTLEELTVKIEGYEVEARSHSAVAAAIAQGKADVGLGIETAASLYGLDFIPLAMEHYDFAVNLESLEKPAVKAFLSLLSSKEFKEALTGKVKGLIPTESTGKQVL
ncbi:MAG: molybdopterin biosynthesis protein, partial [Candidatus Hecatellales archaeon]